MKSPVAGAVVADGSRTDGAAATAAADGATCIGAATAHEDPLVTGLDLELVEMEALEQLGELADVGDVGQLRVLIGHVESGRGSAGGRV